MIFFVVVVVLSWITTRVCTHTHTHAQWGKIETHKTTCLKILSDNKKREIETKKKLYTFNCWADDPNDSE